MEWLGGLEDPASFMSLSLDTNAFALPHLSEDDLMHPLTLASGSSDTHPVTVPSAQWTHYPQASFDHFKFLGEMLASPYKDVLEGTHSFLGELQFPNGSAELQLEHNDIVMPSNAKPAYFSHHCNSWKETFLRPHNAGELVDSSMNPKYQNHDMSRAKPNEDNCNDSLPHSGAKVSAMHCLSKKKRSPRRRAAATDRRRKLRITGGIEALQQLLPQSKEKDKAYLLDNIIDHIKLLQLHIKELSRSRLEGQPSSEPFIFIEGHGHFLLNERLLNESLEEMMGKLLKTDALAAARLFKSRGLSLMPMTLSEGLDQVF